MTPMTEAEDRGFPARLAALRALSAPLEPQPDERRRLTDLAVEHVETFLAGVPTDPAWVDGTGAAETLERFGVAEGPRDPQEVLGLVSRFVDRPGVATTSPRYFGYIPSGGLFTAAVGDFLAAAANRYAGLSSVSPGAAALESVVVRWLADVVGLGASAGGVLTSGGSSATLTAVVAARDALEVLPDVDDLVVYLGEDTHHSVDVALRVAGLGSALVRRIRSDDRLRMDPASLAAAVRADRAAGRRPFLVVATAGTTNAGAVDPLEVIADVAAAEKLWLHVDAAYGGLFALCAEGREVLAGLGRADSLVVDPHKTLFVPYGTGALLLRDVSVLRETFEVSADYLASAEAPSPADLGPELTRPFRAMRVWLPLQLAGRQAFEAALTEKLLLARHAHTRLAAADSIQVGPAPDLSIVTFRVSGNADSGATATLAADLQRAGHVFLTTATSRGHVVARLAIGSFRTHLEHVDAAVDAVLAAASERARRSPARASEGGRGTPAPTVALDPRPRLEFIAGHADPQLLQCELEVLHGRYGDTAEDLEEAYGAYAPYTVWLAVRQPAGRVLGWCRLITPGPLPQKTLTDLTKPPWSLDAGRAAAEAGVDAGRVWDIATIGVRRELGSGGAQVAAALYHGIIRATAANEVATVVAMLDERVLRLLRRLGLLMHPLPGSGAHPYMGSPAIMPVYAHMAEVAREQQRRDPALYRSIALGEGLADLVVPGPEAFRLPAPVVDLREPSSRSA